MELSGRDEQGREAAKAAAELAERVPYPVGKAAAREAGGVVGPPAEAPVELQRAREAWQALQRPLDAARCELLLGQRLLESDPPAALRTLDRAAAEYDQLGVAHLAARARGLAGAEASAQSPAPIGIIDR